MRRIGQAARSRLFTLILLVAGSLVPLMGSAAPYAALVMDARNGQVIHSRNADTPLHPASLTKMMTLYVAFVAIQRGEITLDTEVRITAEAAAQPPSRLGLRTGQTIRLRYLLRAAAVKSANDAATAIGIAVAGSEEAFAARMNATAAAMGMSNTHFINMHGLTQEGHYSTARDMSILGRHVVYDFPQYYNLFSRRTADAGIAQVTNTNTRFLDAYRGADGIKTGYTIAAGYNLVASAERDGVRIIATVFGGTSTANRNARVTELLDMGFAAAPATATQQAPALVAANNNAAPGRSASGGQVLISLRPQARAGGGGGVAAAIAASVAAGDSGVGAALAEPEVTPGAVAIALASPPPSRPSERIMTAEALALGESAAPEAEVVTRLSASDPRTWGINVGSYNSQSAADRVLIQVAVAEASVLDGGVRRITPGARGFDANILGLNRDAADLACRRLQARGMTCFTIGTE